MQYKCNYLSSKLKSALPFFFKKFDIFIYLWLCWVFTAVLRFSPVAGSCSLAVVPRILSAVASLTVEQRL